jgi:cytochrome c-type biogenesis protein CcmH/NrfG
MEPANAELHRLLGDTEMQAGRTASALRSYVRVTKLAPDDAAGFASAARAAHKLGDKEVALNMARRAVELDPASDVRSLLP